MTRKPHLTFLTITILLTLILPITACQKHNHFNATSYNTALQKETHDNGATLTIGIIAGIVVGGIAFIVIIVLLTLCITRRCADHPTTYQRFADWRKDRNLTSVEIDRRNLAKPVGNGSGGDSVDRARHHPRETV